MPGNRGLGIKAKKCLYEGVGVVVVGQTAGSNSSKTLACNCLCTLELCTASMITPVNSDIWGILCIVFFQAVLEKFTVLLLTTSLGRAFQVVGILIGLKCWTTDVLNVLQ